MSEFSVPVSRRSARSEKDVKSYMEAGNRLLRILSCEAILALSEGLRVIELHSCGGFGYRRDAADGDAKASYSLCAEVISRKEIRTLMIAIFISF